MAKLILLSVIISLASLRFCFAVDAEVPGRLVRLISGRTSSTVSCNNHFGALCSDCNTLMTCVGDSSPVAVQNCEATYPGKPLCVNNACVSQPSPDTRCAVTIRCTAAGYFPHPTNCAQFFLCSTPSGNARIYECPSGFAYNPLTTMCKRRVTADDCVQIDCASNKNRYVAYAGDRGYYAYCLNTVGVSDPIMFKCPDYENFKFNQSAQQCQFECRESGRVPDYANCRGYFECFEMEHGGFITRKEDCGNFVYNAAVQQCVQGTCANSPWETINKDTPSILLAPISVSLN